MTLLSYKGYQGTIEASLEEGCLFGKVIHIVDVIGYDGQTLEELRVAFEQAVDGYLQFCQEVGKNPDKAFSGSFNIRITPELHKEMSVIAIQNNISLNNLIGKTLEDYAKSQRAANSTHTA